MAGSYKTVIHTSTFGCVSDAFSAIEELGSECREVYDNMESGNLGQTQRCQTFGETADTLESVSEVEVPDCLQDEPLTYSEEVPRRKRHNTSRAVRCSNIVSILQAAVDRARDLQDDDRFDDDQKQEIESFADELENEIGSIEGVEFPGMFG